MNKTKLIILLLLIIVKISETYSLCAHASKFGTDQACHDYLVQVRWNGTPQCPACENNHMNYYLSNRKVYKCSKCYKQFSVIQGTIFHKSKVPLHKWFMAIYLFTTHKRGISSIQLGKFLGVKQHTAWYMLCRLREAMKEENNIVLHGIVEADETLIAPKVNRDKRLQVAKAKHDKEQDKLHGYSEKKRKRIEGGVRTVGRKKGSTKDILEQKKLERGGTPYRSKVDRVPFEKGTVVLGMLERNGRIVLKKIGTNRKSVSKENIHPHLIRNINRKSIFITDEHNVYKKTSEFFSEHKTINHQISYCYEGIHSNGIENVWNHLKRMIVGTYFHFSFHHADGYLNESTYRWNRQNDSEQTLFEDFIPLIIGKKVVYKEIIRENKFAA